jgi:hypothetical protein
MTLSSPLKINLRLGGSCRLYLQGRRLSQSRNRNDAGSKQSLGNARVLCSIIDQLRVIISKIISQFFIFISYRYSTSSQFYNALFRVALWLFLQVHIYIYIFFFFLRVTYDWRSWTVLNVESSVFWDVRPCNLAYSFQRFEGTFCIHYQGTE